MPERLTAPERETVITFNDAEATARISTHQRRIITKLERNPSAVKIQDLEFGSTPGGEWELPSRLLTFRSGPRKNPGAEKNLPKRA